MARLKLELAYVGSAYQGWQKQKHTTQTVQSQLEQALKKLFCTHVYTRGAGRTDAGVHARAQVCHAEIPNLEAHTLNRYRIVTALNSLLPKDICIKKAWLVPKTFCALNTALFKEYRYKMLFCHDPFGQPFSWVQAGRTLPDLDVLNTFAKSLCGKKNFKSFQTSGSLVKSSVRKIISAHWRHSGSQEIEFIIRGDAFLKQMVRNIVGTKWDLYIRATKTNCYTKAALAAKLSKDITQIIKAQTRTAALVTAPAKGLVLHRVHYPPAKWQRLR